MEDHEGQALEPAGARAHQTFPVLTWPQVETASRFASAAPRRFEPGEDVFRIGDRGTPVWLVIEGSIEAYRHDGFAGDKPITTHRARQFTGEVSQLAGRASLAGGRAGGDGCSALPFDAAHIRALIIGSAELGEIVMRAFILRRVGLIEAGGAGSVLVGVPGSGDLTRLQGFLTRSGYPHIVVDAALDGEGHALAERLGVLPAELPLMVCPNGAVLRRPSNVEAAVCLGITPDLNADTVYDVVIVGAGPAGLAAAVYATSEGLTALVLDERAVGGQAGASARIENYLGFPTGISGQALAGRAFNQALKFGAEIAVPVTVGCLDCAMSTTMEEGRLRLSLPGDRTVQAHTVVIASGARYRRPDIHNLADFDDAGVSYWASPVEAKLCEGEEIALVGGGNSAGQAVAYLAARVKRLHLVVRRPLEETMSRYLIERISALRNVEIHVGAEVVALEGDRANGLSAAVFRNRTTGAEHSCPMRHLFLFIGADPNADWLAGCVDVDEKGFVVTGHAFEGSAAACRRAALPLETSLPGVFAIGDVRAGSTKRVAAAVGEGAAVVAQIHAAIAFARS